VASAPALARLDWQVRDWERGLTQVKKERTLKHRLEVMLSIFALGAALVEAPAVGQQFGPVSIHGAGGITFGQTDDPNTYLAGTPDGSWDTHELSLTVLATPTENLLVGAQVWWGVHNPLSDDPEVNLHQAFAQYRFSDSFKLRAGVMRQPFGLYSETLEMGTLRPFINLPVGVYAPASQQWDGYEGVGFTGTLFGGSSWPLDYDVYGGSMWADGTGLANPVFGELPEDSTEMPDARLKDVIGGRLRLHTPVDGLAFGLASYAGTADENAFTDDRNYVYLASAEFLNEHWSVRAEYARRYLADLLGRAAYVETAYKFTPHWEVAGRWDWTEVNGPFITGPFAMWFYHRDVAGGINYHFNDNFVLKASLHQVKGNFFSFPLDGIDFAAGETPDNDTQLFQLGAQFNF
jgi:hypothetical protein